VLSLAIDWNNPNTIYAGTSFVSPNGPTYIYKSTNAGTSWFNSSNGLDTSTLARNPVRALSISTVNTSVILAGLFQNSGPETGGPYLSTNAGALWIRIGTGLPLEPGQILRSALIRLGSSREFYLGIDSPDSGGVFRTTNMGQSWINYNGGSLPAYFTVRSLWSSDAGIYAGALGMHFASKPIGIINNNGNIPAAFSLHQNFPNPFNPATYIQYDIPKRSYVVIKVYDINGKEIRILVNETKHTGSYQVLFDGSSLSSGVYFYRLMTDEFTQTKKMTLVK
jgi:type IX secretion system substrate protein